MALTDKELEVLRNCISGVETGGNRYGGGRYDDFTPAYANAKTEHAITIGKYQHYGNEAKQLLLRIRKADPELFAKLDTAKVGKDLTGSWAYYKVVKNSAKAKCIQKIISSDVGIKCQDEMMNDQMKQYAEKMEKLGITDHQAICMAINWFHQAQAAPSRILKKTKKPYTLDNLYEACKTDTGNQVGAYKTRQRLVYTWLKEYWPSNKKNEEKKSVATKESTPSVTKATATKKSGYNKTTQWVGKVNVNDPNGKLNFRTAPSTSAANLKSYPTLNHNWQVNVCDEIKVNGKKWYYISYKGKYGFVSAKYIVKVK